ncbi:MAG: signal peptidase II Aspartic peptidase. MEROPS family A08 [Candidatus Kentron sp. G]|nr:MAG: signal peptidase II Aspartic peptidase. MEROPS family A08 [Candidatus Kentron sp. G]VFN02099.1 MAG: signal peptidase II Aspartic peptidase. MEROPS family A08 [Candidatus Kentron sp. G]VFN03959.1 MAG: signal peptidase II Aspartic peptidase. MEROPS family A08 [Candidatus Kentron sp. G]
MEHRTGTNPKSKGRGDSRTTRTTNPSLPSPSLEPAPITRWLAWAALIVILDQGTKYLASTLLTPHVPVAILPFLSFTLTYNPGAAFSFLSDAGGWQRWLFAGLSAGVSIVLIGWLRAIPRGRLLLPAALTLVLGGALGNLWDRLMQGAVVDFIDLHYRGWHFPTFNVADSAITVGAFLLFITLLAPGSDGSE